MKSTGLTTVLVLLYLGEAAISQITAQSVQQLKNSVFLRKLFMSGFWLTDNWVSSRVRNQKMR